MKRRKKLGLALGSGGARGFCHIGVLQAFQEHDIPVDFLTGCSMGALIGACYAVGLDPKDLKEVAESVNQYTVMDLGLSARKFGLIKGERAMTLVRELIGEYSFEDTKIPFQVTCTDLKRGVLRTIREGKLIDAVRASISIPVAFQAFEDANGDMLVDGGVLQRIPIPQLKDMGADVVVAVDALGAPQSDFEPKSLVDIVERTYMLMDWYGSSIRQKEADILIIPDQDTRAIRSFKENGYSVEQGKKAALEMLPAIRELLR